MHDVRLFLSKFSFAARMADSMIDRCSSITCSKQISRVSTARRTLNLCLPALWAASSRRCCHAAKAPTSLLEFTARLSSGFSEILDLLQKTCGGRQRCKLKSSGPSTLYMRSCVLPSPRIKPMRMPVRCDNFCTALTAGSSSVPSLPFCGAWSDSWALCSPLPYHIAGPLSNWSYGTSGTFTLVELVDQTMVRNEVNTAKAFGVGCRPCWRTKMSSALWVCALESAAF